MIPLAYTIRNVFRRPTQTLQLVGGSCLVVLLIMGLSKLMGKCASFPEDSLLNLLQSYQLPDQLREPIHLKDLRTAMHSDKKVNRGKLRFVVMEEVGDAFCSSEPTMDQVDQVWGSVGAV